MKQHIKKYFSILFLVLFLFPMVEKQVHAFQHSSDLHCTNADKHFHQVEHSCSICDFTYTESNASTENNFSFLIHTTTFNYISFFESIHTVNAFKHLPCRAPPIV